MSDLKLYYDENIDEEVFISGPEKFSGLYTMFLKRSGGPIVNGEDLGDVIAKFYDAMTILKSIEVLLKTTRTSKGC